MMKLFFLFHLLLSFNLANAQFNDELLTFKRYSSSDSNRAGFNSTFGRSMKYNDKINYLAPLEYAYDNQKQQKEDSRVNQFYDNLSQTLSFLGDYKSVLECLRLAYDSVDIGLSNLLQKKIQEYKGAL